MSSEAERLFSDYNAYWMMTAHIEARRRAGGYFRLMKATKERLELLTKMAEWCRGRGLDPRLWLYSLFRARAWQYAPKLEPGFLMSNNMIERYHRLSGLDGYRKMVQDERTEETRLAGKTYDPNRDINATIESRKTYYVNSTQTDRCMREMVAETLGFHPHSSACRACPAQVECKRRLEDFVDFDIIALREGRITSGQAMAQVRRAAT